MNHDPTTVTLDRDEAWPLLLFAVRYCFGRQSYGPSLVSELVQRYSRILGKTQLLQVADEVEKDLEWRDRIPNVDLPPDIVRTWGDLVCYLKNEAKKRGE